MKKRLIIPLLLIGIMLCGFGCSASKKSPPLDIEAFTLFDTITFEEPVLKAHYHGATKNIFAHEVKTHRILIFKDGKQINAIGGLGSQSSNFLRLEDITMGRDGSIYALDGGAREVKRFNPDGKYMGTMKLEYVQQPKKIALGREDNLFIYDGAASEIVVFDLLDGSELYRFGKFQLQNVDKLYAGRDFLIAYDKERDTSAMFSILGQFISEDNGQIIFDEYNNAISLSNDALISKMSAAWLPMGGKPGFVTINNNILAIVVDNQVRLLKIDYAQVL
ncbi:MAG: 6-bladed beta-propeller [Candidatus Cloacimonetes bacterium]|nr:6-bladed beta-propeller [Candidatus Cloacimonadota bacterium]NLO44549.1 hypothetical protein [Candidatus Cloacimonadota bacterium]